MSMDNVVTIAESASTCPECKGQHWFIILDGFGFTYEGIKEFQCAYCGWTIGLKTEVSNKAKQPTAALDS